MKKNRAQVLLDKIRKLEFDLAVAKVEFLEHRGWVSLGNGAWVQSKDLAKVRQAVPCMPKGSGEPPNPEYLFLDKDQACSVAMYGFVAEQLCGAIASHACIRKQRPKGRRA